VKSKRKKSGTVSSIDAQVRCSATELFNRTDELIDELQYDLAEIFCKRAVEREPDNIAYTTNRNPWVSVAANWCI